MAKLGTKFSIFYLTQIVVTSSLLNALIDFLKVRKQRVILNSQLSICSSTSAGDFQGLIIGPLLSLIYFDDLFDNLSYNLKPFTDATSLFSVVRNINQLG